MSKQAISDLKQQAHADLLQIGFPTRKDEDWKYTSTDALVKHAFELNADDTGVQVAEIPSGVVVLPMHAAWETHADLIMRHLGQIMPQAHGFHAQNMAYFNAGFFIFVPENLKASTPLHLVHTPVAGKMQCVRHLVIAGASSELQIIETYESNLDDPYFTNTMTEMSLDAHARLSHLKLQREGMQAFHVGEVAVKQAASSHFESHSLSLGAAWARSDTTVEFLGTHASSVMNGIYMPSTAQHIDHHTTVKHSVPDCVSAQDYKGILKDKACAVFNGKVQVAVDAVKTEAKQYNKNILLSPNATVKTKPELQIFTDDVTCAHGATVGQLDEEALFYLATRGIDANLAHRYLMRAFLADNLNLMKTSGLAHLNDEFIMEHME